MKYLFTLILFTVSLPLFSQKNDTSTGNNNRSVIPISLNEIHGYIDGIRLDSINSLFATFDFPSKQSVTFDYGQNWIEKSRYVITDSIGKPLRFNILLLQSSSIFFISITGIMLPITKHQLRNLVMFPFRCGKNGES